MPCPKLEMDTRTLPSLPQAAAQILSLLQDPDVSIAELVRAIELEPAVAVKILTFANSSFLGCSQDVTGLRHALVLMGLRTAKMVTLGFCVTNTFPKPKDEQFHWAWQRNVINASVARHLARICNGVDAETAFLSSLIQDMGVLVRLESLGDDYRALITASQSTGKALHELEREYLGSDHSETSADLVEHWKLSDQIAQNVRQHHAEDFASDVMAIPAAAESLTNFILTSAPEHIQSYADAVGPFKLDEGSAERVIGDVTPLVKDLGAMLTVDNSNSRSFASLLSKAQQQLISMSIETNTTLAQNQAVATKLQQENEDLSREVQLDSLTGLGNRRRLDELLVAALSDREETRDPLTLVLCDIDRFKQVNDTFGHGTGDDVLIRVSKLLQDNTRMRDNVCRFGGEEFAIVLPKVAAEQARIFTDRLRVKISELQFPPRIYPEKVTASFGAATIASDGAVSPAQLIQAADEQLYEAKESGRNRAEFVQL